MMVARVFTAVGFVFVRERQLLLVRSKGKRAFYLPGGKPEPGETELETLTRECREELSVDLSQASLALYREYVAPAYGEPAGVKVVLRCYRGVFTGAIVPAAEIEEVRYFTSALYRMQKETAPAVRMLFLSLRKDNIVL